jgi:CBS-domain-containing membrane protein
VQVRDVMTRDVQTVGLGTSAKYAAELMAAGGFAAIPVVDDEDHVVGIVAEADVLRDRLPEDPRLHLRRDGEAPPVPPLLVAGVMTRDVCCVEAAADLADVTRLVLEHQLRSAPVVDDGRLVGIVSRRDVLRSLVRPDAEIRREVLRLVEEYTGELGAFAVDVTEGVVTVTRSHGLPQISREVEERALTTLATTVGGVVGIRVLHGATHPVAVAPNAGAGR